MRKYLIEGGAPLFGSVTVDGSKNSALPILFAAITVRDRAEIYNLPDIGDVRCALDILRTLGVEITQKGDKTTLDMTAIRYADIPDELTSRLRASTYLLGAMTARFGTVRLSPFGGCSFSSRPIDLHISALRSFGATVDGHTINIKRLTPAEIHLPLPSVGATVNSLILAASTEGESRICAAAVEPHILDLVDFLRSGGAEIDIVGNSYLVRGRTLESATAHVRGDMVEAGTYLAAGIATGGRVTVRGVDPAELGSFLSPLERAGVRCERGAGFITVTSQPNSPINITTAPYPGFPTDLQPIIAPLMALKGGTITDTIWRSRFGYLDALLRFGIHSRGRCERAEIFHSEPKRAEASSPDLRGGAALVIAALMAEGESSISGIELIERGYRDLPTKLSRLGADIALIDT